MVGLAQREAQLVEQKCELVQTEVLMPELAPEIRSVRPNVDQSKAIITRLRCLPEAERCGWRRWPRSEEFIRENDAPPAFPRATIFPPASRQLSNVYSVFSYDPATLWSAILHRHESLCHRSRCHL